MAKDTILFHLCDIYKTNNNKPNEQNKPSKNKQVDPRDRRVVIRRKEGGRNG